MNPHSGPLRRLGAAGAVAAALLLAFTGVAEAATVAKATGKPGKDPRPATQLQCDGVAGSIDLLTYEAYTSKDPAVAKRLLTSAKTLRAQGEWYGCEFTTSGTGTSARTKATATGHGNGKMRAATQSECDSFASVLDDLQEGLGTATDPRARDMIQQAWNVVYYGGEAMGCVFSSV